MMKGGKLINEKQLGVRMINLVLTVENSSAVLAVEISLAFFCMLRRSGHRRGLVVLLGARFKY